MCKKIFSLYYELVSKYGALDSDILKVVYNSNTVI